MLNPFNLACLKGQIEKAKHHHSHLKVFFANVTSLKGKKDEQMDAKRSYFSSKEMTTFSEFLKPILKVKKKRTS